MQIGIIGMPQSGKTTVFNALTGSTLETGLGGTKEMSQAVVKVPDERLTHLAKIYNPKKTTPASVTYIDLCGMGRGNIDKDSIDAEFLAQLRTVDAIIMVVRHFQDDSVPHQLDTIDAKRDADKLIDEMTLADLIVIENKIDRSAKENKKAPSKDFEKEKQLLIQFKALLESGKPIRATELSVEEDKLMRGYRFLTQKPLLICANISEDDLKNEAAITAMFDPYKSVAHTGIMALSAKIEAEIAVLSADDAKIFMQDLGIQEAALTRLIRESYSLCGLISFFTFGEDECRAWTIAKGTNAQRSAGSIHSDLEKGFIRAETIAFADFLAHGDMNGVKKAGRMRLEGKEYVVQDGDMLTIRFNN
ncbi:MAG: redox-regulated ATPase YchF [Candidatus Raymondbacteria bacterium RifOxyA12_full_50_37]|uniref:Redox-regulated ATPase YchF n=1 Tax=Candidatus Raymondbacteria bacterium RIFOXYD12_FULL_49_13 TaxID=1817890 RepID=A0A1F7FE90_UNCRA|nr:MAG: redox-regulated ATPase YchF [Candidatus Raymondbacteria bacterium RifOxyA12_full_50_37]OGJ91122.1 MAG: redox-regulated ATPase YchF [Candidatus Raymondbacteria bacterium RIFOXYA2_FULL_49_16]OGJ97519.1 MAG: redox-regulated ATPase YchF [Candidatus Raymondbacteria bacterium RIFOXYC2_FULL_50_21]OGK00177.1 MAG: redox-regulated ATPase YchF [Candidatus Raymondbacteria bacterium RifOxyB12_full_50_8]OGK04994.1 MAG: redox-regulated ATPase YchF [Candidatus Raymondbacteria bacterium RIFOXYD12_FULL_4